MSIADLFAPLERVVKKYRRDVHRLGPETPPEALIALEAHLGRTLPRGLRIFLARHNGAELFRGAIRIRSTSAITFASELSQAVVLFADSNEGERWAWATDDDGNTVFGVWDDERLESAYSSFAAWLKGTIAVLDTKVVRPSEQAELRFEAAPDDRVQLLLAGDRALQAGRPEQAEVYFRRATRLSPHHVLAWQRLGEALAVSDRVAARAAWLEAFRATRLPLPWPGAPCLDPDILRSLPAAFDDPDAWERELTHFLSEQVRDVRSAEEERLVVAAAAQRARSLVQRGRRTAARDVLASLLQRAALFTWPGTPWTAVLELAKLEVDLGNHDAAEKLIRQVRRAGPEDQAGPALLLLARIAVTRQEPWAEEILDEAEAAGLSAIDLAHASALRIERALRLDGSDSVERWLEQVRTGARSVASRPVQGLLALAEGDATRLRGQMDKAGAAYARGARIVEPEQDPELHFRLLMRLGDLDYEAQRVRTAEQRYLTAARGFAKYELPVREGWALLRLARTSADREQLVQGARERFVAAQLATGVAAADALVGDPGLSLTWHLNHATDHAKARQDAQRPKPPYERADADRPERRLGAHRLAIAACSDRVVVTIATELDVAASAMSTSSTRPHDPAVMRYIAAVDLLAGHPSFEAAQVLLDHLLRRAVSGNARRALQGAIARSPNAALVDGLLSHIEAPEESIAPAVAEAAELLGMRRERAAIRPLLRLAEKGSHPLSRKSAIVALGRIGDRRVVERLVTCLDEPLLAEQAALALLMLGDRRGVDFHGRALNDGCHDLTGNPGEILGRYGGPEYLVLLRRIGEGNDERRIMGALHGLGLLGDPRGAPTLLQQLDNRNREVSQVASEALQLLTGHAEEMDDPGSRTRWNLWWEREGDRFAPGVRHRHGKVLDAGVLIERMRSDDSWVRRTSYDELVITTGVALPFDSDGPWRLQQAHLRAWGRWWIEHRAVFQSGRWYLDGQAID